MSWVVGFYTDWDEDGRFAGLAGFGRGAQDRRTLEALMPGSEAEVRRSRTRRLKRDRRDGLVQPLLFVDGFMVTVI